MEATPEAANAPRSRRGGLGSRPLCTRSASTAWRARSRASRAPIHSDLQGHPYCGRIAVPHEHWDGSARRRKVDYGTRRLGDRELYPRGGSGGPGDVSRGL